MRTQPTQEWVLGESSAGPPDGYHLPKLMCAKPTRTVARRMCVIFQRHGFKLCTLLGWLKLAGNGPSIGLSLHKTHSGLNTLVDSLI